MRRAEIAVLIGMLGLGLGVQLYFFHAYPQPILFGDPRGYYETGQRFLDALHSLGNGTSLSAAFDSVRGLLLLLGTGAIFTALEALRPGDFAFFRIAFACFNTAAMLGTFFLGRRLARSIWGGWIGLALAVVYPAFSVQTGRLYPDPVTGCLFVWATYFYLAGVERESRRLLAAAGLALAAGLLVRTQLIAYMFVALPLAFALSAGFWLRRAGSRKLALTLALSLTLLPVTWSVIGRAVGSRDDVLRFGNLTYQTPYPVGFWMFIENDGWPLARFKDAPYYREMEQETRRRPGLLSSRPRQAIFTLRYVAARPLASLLTVLENGYRLYARPANDYKWDYPFDYDAQVIVQQGACVLALAGAALFVSESTAALGVFFLPLSLLALHGVMFSWPRYNVPVMPILLGVAGACAARLLQSAALRCARQSSGLRVCAVAAAIAVVVAEGLFAAVPEIAHALHVLGVALVLALPFIWVAIVAATRRAQVLALLAGCGLACLVLPHLVRDYHWHEGDLEVGGPLAVVEQKIGLSAADLTTLRQKREAFVAFEMTVPRGVAEGVTVEVNGHVHPGADLVPTMPRLPESTETGGRDWRRYPQWWVLPVKVRELPVDAATPLLIRLSAKRPDPLLLRYDRFAGQERVYNGPSFGNGPYTVALKLEYDADYRRPATYELRSRGTRTSLVTAQEERRQFSGQARIRIVTLSHDEGSTRWQTAAAPAARTAFGFHAYTGTRGIARLSVSGKHALDVPLDATGNYEVTAGPFRLCRRERGERGNMPYGAFIFESPSVAGSPLELSADFTTGMSERPMYFIVDGRRPFSHLTNAFEECGIAAGMPRAEGAARVLEADRNKYPDDTGRWSVDTIY